MAEQFIVKQRAEMLVGSVLGLKAVLRSVCPLCARGERLFCEIIDGEATHITGPCLGSSIRGAIRHLDDVRDQFANEWNPSEEPRSKWFCRNQ